MKNTQECNPTFEKMGAALVSLMRENPFEKITADQIAKTAGTGRATYFRNFSSKTELLAYYLLCCYKRYYAEHGSGKSIHEKSREGLLCLLRFCESIRDTHMLITECGQEAAIYMAYRNSFLEEETGDWKTVCHNALIDYGMLGVIHEWLRSGCSPSAEEVADWLLTIIKLT